MLSTDDEVPPLEDLSIYFKKKESKQDTVTKADNLSSAKTLSTSKASPQKEFSGFKKGFLSTPKLNTLKSKPKPKTIGSKDEIPYIKYTPKTTATEFPEIAQVKEKLNSQLDQRNSDWMTPDFLQKIESSPVLKAAFEDPRFLEISQELARDPVGTMKIVSKSMPQFVAALKEFTGLIGEAMDNRANLEESKSSKLDTHEQQLVDRVLQDEAAKDALKDPEVLNLLGQLRTDSSQSLAKVMALASPSLRAKIQSLISCGLLSIFSTTEEASNDSKIRRL